MIISTLNEDLPETRVAITPSVVKTYKNLGLKVLCETGAGLDSGFKDEDYRNAGALVLDDRLELLKQTQILLTVNEPQPKKIKGLAKNALVIGPCDKVPDSPLGKFVSKEKLSLFSMNLIPRISRAQNLDSLSSQANLAGYRAVLEGVVHFNRAIPMMMTAAGMIQPAKILILGAGVAGLQAIATAKRLGAVVYAFDVRQAVKEQVESLGAEFIEVANDRDLETSSGYAEVMPEEYKTLQAQLIDKYAQLADIIICTALIPGKKAPLLITKETIHKMRPHSVIVDLATARGGNCALSKKDKIVKYHGILLIGFSNLAGLVPATASELYANNLANLIPLLIKGTPPTLQLNQKDEIIQQALLYYAGIFEPFSKKETSND